MYKAGQRIHSISLLLVAIYVILFLIITSCSGGGGTTPEPNPYPNVGAGWVTITGYHADPISAYLTGKAFISPTWYRCCSGSAEDTGVSVTWTNLTTGVSGPAWQYAKYCWFFGTYLCGHTWSADVPLVPGSNGILITATDPGGNIGRDITMIEPPPDTTPPSISSTEPSNNAIGVPVNTAVTANFSEPVDPATITTVSFLLRDSAGNPISGSVTMSGSTAIFTPATELENTMVYTATVTTVVHDLAGNALASDYQWLFTTANAPDTTPPSVTSITPGNGVNCATIDGSITATFDEAMDPLTINGSIFLLRDGSAQLVNGSVTYANNTATFQPYLSLAYSSPYQATITSGARDLAGNLLAADYTWTFTTEPTPTGTWQPTATTGAPSARDYPTAIWTGSEVIMWGGSIRYTGYTNTGGRYNPATDSWQPTSTLGAPIGRVGHSAVWTGQEMIVWGSDSRTNTGGRYDPAADSWKPTSTLGAPMVSSSTAVWTGGEMIVWGGGTATGVVNTGARYNPANDTWQNISTADAPTGRIGHTAVWTGSEMIVWGGIGDSGIINTGARYNPQTDTWSAVTTTAALSARLYHSAVWTGSEMIVWGGHDTSAQALNTGGRYNPLTDTWTHLSTVCAPAARYSHVAIWTGTHTVVWGGYNGQTYFDSGAVFDPITDGWIATPRLLSPEARAHASAVWAGDRMVLWGGYSLNTGGSYIP